MAAHLGTTAAQQGPWGWWRNSVDAIAILLAAAVGGAALVWLSVRFDGAGPLVFIGIAALPLLTLVLGVDPRVGLLLVFLTFPFSTLITTVGPLPLEPVELAVAVVTAAVVVIRLARRAFPLGWHPAVGWLIALLAWTTVALPSATDQTAGVKQVLSVGAAVVFVCAVLAICGRVADVTWSLGALIAVAAAAAAFALVTGEAPQSVYGGAVIADRLAGPFNQPNQLGSFAAMTALAAGGIALGSRSPRVRVAAAAGALLLLGALALSLSRGAWIGAAVGIIVLVGMLRSGRSPLLVAAGVAALAVAGAALIAPDAPQVQIVGARLEVLTTQSPYDTRDAIWAEARRQIAADPVTGHGPANFPVASTQAASEAGSVYADHAHNLFLNWAAEVGLPGAILIGGLIVAVGVAAARARRAARDDREAAIVAGLAGGLTSVVVHGMVDYPLGNRVLWFSVWSLVALLLAVRRAQLALISRAS